MLILVRPSEMLAYVGQSLGPSDWLVVDQTLIDLFAKVTDDHNWIHVDSERAKRELPGGVPIAHGFLTVSLLPRLTRTIFQISHYSKSLNYGANRIRLTAAVPSGSRIRLKLDVKDVVLLDGATRMTFHNIVEIDGSNAPALIAETIFQYYD
jgi:acyl dehydratase